MIPRPTVVTTLVAALAGLVLPALVVAPATAAPGPSSRPLPQDDAYGVYASGEYTFPVLENDSTSILGDGELTLCGVTVDPATQQSLYAEIDRTDPSRVYLETRPTASGEVSFTYDACQGDRRATSTVTITITRLSSPTVAKKKNRRARITATNPNDAQVEIIWGSNQAHVNDGRRVIGAGRTVTIKVSRTRVYWVAFVRDQGAVVVVGDGTVQKIKKTKRSRRVRT